MDWGLLAAVAGAGATLGGVAVRFLLGMSKEKRITLQGLATRLDDERRECQERLAKVEEKADTQSKQIEALKTLARAHSYAYIEADEHGTVLDASGSVLTMFGYTRRELVEGAMNVSALVADAFRPQHERAFSRIARSGRPPSSLPLTAPARHKSGLEFMVEVDLSGSRWQEGKRIFVAAIRELTIIQRETNGNGAAHP